MPYQLLFADDSATMHRVVQITFAREDFTVISVNNGPAAIARAKEVKPDIAVIDISMPGMDGYAVCQSLKSDPATAQIPVLLLAGSQEPFDEGRAQASGANSHVVKPFETQALIDKVKTLVGAPITSAVARPAVAAAPAVAPVAPVAKPVVPTPAAVAAALPTVPRPATAAPLPPAAPAAWSAPPSAGAPKPPAAAPPVQAPMAPPPPRPVAAEPAFTAPRAAVPAPAPVAAAPAPVFAPTPAFAATPMPAAATPMVTPAASVPPALPRPVAVPIAPVAPPRPIATPTAADHVVADLAAASAAVAQSTADVLGAAGQVDPAALMSMAREIIERVAWEVVPALAEALLREQMERNKTQAN